MTRVRILQLALVGGAVVVLELLCRPGIIDRFTMIPPSEMLLALVHVIATGTLVLARRLLHARQSRRGDRPCP